MVGADMFDLAAELPCMLHVPLSRVTGNLHPPARLAMNATSPHFSDKSTGLRPPFALDYSIRPLPHWPCFWQMAVIRWDEDKDRENPLSQLMASDRVVFQFFDRPADTRDRTGLW